MVPGFFSPISPFHFHAEVPVTPQCALVQTTENRGTILGPSWKYLSLIPLLNRAMNRCHNKPRTSFNSLQSSQSGYPLTAPNLFRCLTLRTWRAKKLLPGPRGSFSAPFFLSHQKDFLFTFPSGNNSPYAIASFLPIPWASFLPGNIFPLPWHQKTSWYSSNGRRTTEKSNF